MGGGSKFIHDAAIGFELAFVYLKGVKFKSVFQRRQGQGGRGVSCPPAAVLSSNQIKNYFVNKLSGSLD